MSDLQYTLKPLDWTLEFKKMMRSIAKEIQTLEDDKQRKLASYHTSMALGGYFGLHSKQLLNVRWVDIIKKKVEDTFWDESEVGHCINFHPELIEIIRTNYKICRPFGNHYLIVSNPLKHQKPLIDRTYNNTLAQIMGNYGFDIGREGSHILRKTCAMRLYRERGSGQEALQFVSAFLGHKSLSITRSYLCLYE